MKERILRLLETEALTPSRFADMIGVQRSSVSHVLSGRNNPSFDFLQKTLSNFPGLKADWLVMGNGPMYQQMEQGELDGFLKEAEPDQSDQHVADQEFSGPGTELEENGPDIEPAGDSERMQGPGNQEEPDKGTAGTTGYVRIVQVLIFYSDDTFKSFGPHAGH